MGQRIDASEYPHDPPRNEVFIAFAEAMEQWSKVETQTMLLLGGLADIKDVNRLWGLFHAAGSFSTQCRMIGAVAEIALGDDNRKRIKGLLKELATAAERRNGIVHGIWRDVAVTEMADEGETVDRRYREMFRDYSKPKSPGGSKVSTDADVQELRKQGIRFYLDDLRALAGLFRKLAATTQAVHGQILRELLPKVTP